MADRLTAAASWVGVSVGPSPGPAPLQGLPQARLACRPLSRSAQGHSAAPAAPGLAWRLACLRDLGALGNRVRVGSRVQVGSQVPAGVLGRLCSPGSHGHRRSTLPPAAVSPTGAMGGTWAVWPRPAQTAPLLSCPHPRQRSTEALTATALGACCPVHRLRRVPRLLLMRPTSPAFWTARICDPPSRGSHLLPPAPT